MKAFLIGLVFLVFVFVMMGLGIFLWPLLIVLGLALRGIIFVAFTIFAIWLLGKSIIALWGSLRSKGEAK
ncbi:MAG: hypothetical protein ISS26_04740 [Candidatus Omnitrophica bacterium]|nr:hypothetical protein [Candidatus Omnitrophota bacterium]